MGKPHAPSSGCDTVGAVRWGESTHATVSPRCQGSELTRRKPPWRLMDPAFRPGVSSPLCRGSLAPSPRRANRRAFPVCLYVVLPLGKGCWQSTRGGAMACPLTATEQEVTSFPGSPELIRAEAMSGARAGQGQLLESVLWAAAEEGAIGTSRCRAGHPTFQGLPSSHPLVGSSLLEGAQAGGIAPRWLLAVACIWLPAHGQVACREVLLSPVSTLHSSERSREGPVGGVGRSHRSLLCEGWAWDPRRAWK